jgi:tight adherence protein B
MDPEQTINTIVILAVFGLVFSVWCICLLLWLGQTLARTKLMRKRLGVVETKEDEVQTARLWRDRQRESGNLASKKTATLQERLETLKIMTGWQASAQSVLLRVAGVSLLVFLLTYLSGGSIVLALGLSAAVIVVFWRYVLVSMAKYSALLEMQFVDGLGICARALRAGLPLLGSFQLISEEIDKPVGDIFNRICREQMMGKDLKDSVKKVVKTVPSPELKLFATAIAIQLQSGGNLADLMDSLAAVVRTRIRLNRRVRILTAQTQLSKKVLIALPIILFLLLNVISPSYMVTFYTTTAGKYMLIFMVVTILCGAWIMNKLAVLKF